MKIGGDYVRIVDADALWKEFCRSEAIEERYGSGVLEIAGSIIDNAQTIDAVPVVRCKDCVYWDKDTLRHNSNDVAEWDECECEMLANRDRWNEIDRYCCDIHFCADGERKDNG